MNKAIIYFIAVSLLIIFFSCKEESTTEPKDVQSPSVSVLYPANNSEIVEGEEIIIKVDAEDDTEIQKVEFYIDASKVSTDNSSPYEYKYLSEGKIGTHSLLAKGYDASNNVGLSNVVSFKVVEAVQNVVSGTVTNGLNAPIANAKVTINATVSTTSSSKSLTRNDAETRLVSKSKSKIAASSTNKESNSDKNKVRFDKETNSLVSFLQNKYRTQNFEYSNIPENDSRTTNDKDNAPQKSSSVLAEIYTDQNGHYEITDLTEGNYSIKVVAENYKVYDSTFVQAKGLIQHNVRLQASPLTRVRNLSLSDGNYQINLNWSDITDQTLKGYNVYEKHYISYSDNLSEDQYYFYPEYSNWQKINSQPITVSNFTVSSEEYNARYGFYILPVNIDNEETVKDNYTEIKYLALPSKSNNIADFSLTESIGPFHIPTSTHEVALHMRFYYTDAIQILQINEWKVEYSENNSTWNTLATHILPTGEIPANYYGYTKTFSANNLKGKTVYFRTNPQSFPSPNNQLTIENLVAEYSMDGTGFSSNNPPNMPADPTPVDNAVGINTNTQLSWTCTDPDGDPLTYDVYFGTDSTPDNGELLSENQTSINYNPDVLIENTTYYWKIVVKDNDGGTTEGNVWSFETESGGTMGVPCPGIPTVAYAGKTYNTVQIGNQCWLKENLNYEVNNSWCYDNNTANCETYGRLYTWQAAMNGSTTPGAQGICPNGWHIPTLAEFETLESYVNNQAAALIDESETLNYTPTVTQNETDFSALFAGYRYYYGTFYDLGNVTTFWSSTELNSNYAYYMNLYYNGNNVTMYNYYKESGFSVRCVQD